MVCELALLVRCERAGLLKDAVRDGDLPQVVKAPGELELLDVVLVESELARDRLDEHRHALGVRAGVLVLRIDDANEVLGTAGRRLPPAPPLELRWCVSLRDRGAVRAEPVLAVQLR